LALFIAHINVLADTRYTPRYLTVFVHWISRSHEWCQLSSRAFCRDGDVFLCGCYRCVTGLATHVREIDSNSNASTHFINC